MTRGEETRLQILDRAAQLASEVGLEGLTIGSLARELEISKSGLFAHFQSKETLCFAVLDRVAARFVHEVVSPALKEPRGEPRLRALFTRMLSWPERSDLPGGCLLVAAVSELDDRPGLARDLLVQQQQDWLDALANVGRSAISEGHFGKHVDPEQLAFDIYGIQFAYHHFVRLLASPKAKIRAKHAFEALITAARPR